MHVIVLGVGGVGAMTAWRLAAAGHKVTALEQFRIDHGRGSSYGDSRIVRRVYPDALYTRMMADAYALWAGLMRDSEDDSLFVQCGGLFFGQADNTDLLDAEAALSSSDVPYERLDARECTRRFPAFRLDREEAALYEPSMGYARASRAVRAASRLAVRSGADLREETPAIAIEDDLDGVRVVLASGERLQADRLVVSAGPWASPLLAPLGVNLPVTVTRQPYAHLEPAESPELFEPGRFPVWIDIAANAYGFPRMGDVPGVKIGSHDYGAPTSPDIVDREVRDRDRATILDYSARRFPKLGRSLAYEKVCLYTVTPDNDFIIGALPSHERIVLISACSGHGFKFTPLLGEIAACLATESDRKIDLTRFRLSRFAGND